MFPVTCFLCFFSSSVGDDTQPSPRHACFGVLHVLCATVNLPCFPFRVVKIIVKKKKVLSFTTGGNKRDASGAKRLFVA